MNISFKWINGALILLIAVKVLMIVTGYFLWDDSYMFTRYADNLINFHQLSWNPGGQGTYGLTSILYLSIVLPVRLIVGSNFVITGLASSIISGAAFLALLYLLLKKTAPDEERDMITSVVFSILLFSNISQHFVSGMDTLFDLSFIVLYVIGIKRYTESETRKRIITAGLIGGIAFFVRPDLLLFSFLVPVTMFLGARDRKQRIDILAILGVTAAMVCLQMLFAVVFMHSPLPLPFYAKGTNLYGPNIYQVYKNTSVDQFLLFLKDFWFLFLMSAVYFIIEYKKNKRLPYFDLGLLFATTAFIVYYLFFVLQIMYYYQRFYYPTLPALIYLAVKGLNSVLDNTAWSRKYAESLCIIILLVFTGGFALHFSEQVELKRAGDNWYWKEAWCETDVNKIYQREAKKSWYKLDEFSSLPDDLIMSTSEVGLVSAMNPDKQIIDLVGLNDTDIARNGFSASRFFEKNQPDLIYLPHPDYKEMIEDIKSNQFFKANYELLNRDNVLLEVALKKDSKYYQDMVRIISY